MKASYFLLLLFIVFSCSKDSNDKLLYGSMKAPSNLVASVVSDSEIALSWSDNSPNETGFQIERKTANGQFSIIGSAQPNTTQFHDVNVSSGVVYIYRICSFNTNINSAYSNEVTVTASMIAPSNLMASIVSYSEIALSWSDNSPNETGFQIERKTANGQFSIIGSAQPNTTQFHDVNVSIGVVYFYRICSFNTNINSAYSNEATVTIPISTPILTTFVSGSITKTTAECGGTISSNGGSAITASGVVWSTVPNPTIDLLTKTNDLSSSGSFTSTLTGLLPSTKYYIRAYATNSIGTSYGSELSFVTQNEDIVPGPDVTDIDGNVYHTVKICNQIWTTSNLKVTRYRNGTTIPSLQQGWGFNAGQWTYYQDDSTTEATYGKLYNKYAVFGNLLAPVGYHVPTELEVQTLCNCLGGLNIAGKKMKESGTVHWPSGNDGDNSSGFNALPSGLYYASYNHEFGFSSMGTDALWWTSTTGAYSVVTYYKYFRISSGSPVLTFNSIPQYDTMFLGVRLVKD